MFVRSFYAGATPHSYLDKNVLFDWCDAEAFGATGQKASCELVERVRAGKMVATISASAVTSSFNHVVIAPPARWPRAGASLRKTRRNRSRGKRSAGCCKGPGAFSRSPLTTCVPFWPPRRKPGHTRTRWSGLRIRKPGGDIMARAGS